MAILGEPGLPQPPSPGTNNPTHERVIFGQHSQSGDQGGDSFAFDVEHDLYSVDRETDLEFNFRKNNNSAEYTGVQITANEQPGGNNTRLWFETCQDAANPSTFTRMLIQADGSFGLGPHTTPRCYMDINGRVGVADVAGFQAGNLGQMNIVIGQTTIDNGSWLLEVNGGAYKTDGTDRWKILSDARLKKNIQPLPSGSLEKLLQLRGVVFEWKDPQEHAGRTGRRMGMISQEVEKVFPEWVVTQDGHKSIKYGMQIQMEMLQAIKELKQENDELKERIKALEDAVK